MTVSRLCAPRYVHIYRGCSAFLLLLIFASLPLSGSLPTPWGWENGFLEGAQTLVLFLGFCYALWSAHQQKGSSAALWKTASLFWLAMTARELAWGGAFLPPMGFTEQGPIISSRTLWYRPAVPWFCTVLLVMSLYWLWRYQVIQNVFFKLWKQRMLPMLGLAIFALAMVISGMAEGHGWTALAQWLAPTQPMVLEELVEFWAYAALWLSQWLLVQHTATPSRLR